MRSVRQGVLDRFRPVGDSQAWLEKLLVSLLQQLVNNKLVDPTDLAMGSSGTVEFAIRYRKPAVLKDSAARVYSHYEGHYYVDVLESTVTSGAQIPGHQLRMPSGICPEQRQLTKQIEKNGTGATMSRS